VSLTDAGRAYLQALWAQLDMHTEMRSAADE
jgi:DNA-binding PadR family transcriptional regulator